MICIVEIAMLVMGIIACVKGEVKLSRRKVVSGPAARILGVIMMLPLPVAFMVGMVLGFQAAARGEAGPDMATAVIAELVVVGVVVVTAVVFAMATAKDPTKMPPRPVGGTADGNVNFPPPDPNNPYSSPYASGEQPPPNPFRDQDT